MTSNPQGNPACLHCVVMNVINSFMDEHGDLKPREFIAVFASIFRDLINSADGDEREEVAGCLATAVIEGAEAAGVAPPVLAAPDSKTAH